MLKNGQVVFVKKAFTDGRIASPVVGSIGTVVDDFDKESKYRYVRFTNMRDVEGGEWRARTIKMIEGEEVFAYNDLIYFVAPIYRIRDLLSKNVYLSLQTPSKYKLFVKNPDEEYLVYFFNTLRDVRNIKIELEKKGMKLLFCIKDDRDVVNLNDNVRQGKKTKKAKKGNNTKNVKVATERQHIAEIAEKVIAKTNWRQTI